MLNFLFQIGDFRQSPDQKKHLVKQICTILGISEPTLYAYVRVAQ